MSKRILSVIFLISILGILPGESYTVVLKNGKVIAGKLISETSDRVILKDDQGLQFSFKKGLLDLEKTRAANEPGMTESAASPVSETEPQPEAASPVQTQVPSSFGKEPRVFTNQDVETLTASTEEAKPAEPSEPPPEASAPTQEPATQTAPIAEPSPATESTAEPKSQPSSSPQSEDQLKQAVDHLTKVLTELTQLGNRVTTAWEVAASTGKDSRQAVREYMSSAGAVNLRGSVSSGIVSLQGLPEKWSNPPEGAEGAFTNALDAIKSYYNLLQQYQGIQNISAFRSRLAEIAGQINSSIEELQSFVSTPAATPEP